VVTFGLSRDVDIHPEMVETIEGTPVLHLQSGISLRSPLMGWHNAYNVMAAVSVARHFHLNDQTIQEGLEAFQTMAGRMEKVVLEGVEFLNDAYNANPVSLKESVDTLMSFPTTGKRIAVVGDMLELGPDSSKYHLEAGEYLGEKAPDVVITVGKFACSYTAWTAAESLGRERVLHAADPQDAAEVLRSVAKKGDLVLLKGSRGIELEKILDWFPKTKKLKRLRKKKNTKEK
jgi:UDP-N-acetylmuramoyl-tripeptide--D-alanyl-D-alanine ligase